MQVGEQPVEVMIDVPVVKQAYRNNSEAAALEMLLATRGVDRDQKELQGMPPLSALASRWVGPPRTPSAQRLTRAPS